ncbi:MAG: DNA primase [Oscillospiraceae bacterium]|nr:DNA primase [Oscillospiraceae bacterium]
MAFPPSFLDDLNARNPIEDVVGQYVALTRRGSNYFGLCPFHNEKTASFSVAPDKGIYYCFGCHKGGGAVNFIMEVENLEYPDAVRFLAKRVGMEVPEDQEYRSAYRKQERLRNLCKEAARYFHEQLNSPAGQPGREYIAKRGLTRATVTKFGIGFAPDGWHGLLDTMTKKGYTKEELLDADLVIKSPKGNYYDKFRNRLMFPIIDIRGSIIGFGGRVMDDSKPKYLNTSETSIFNKRKNLFAMNFAKKSTAGRIILTEGYLDAIALYQYGFDCAVASLGTALTTEQAQLLGKYTGEVVLTYDNDAAGQNATRRAITILERADLKIKILRMQGAKDPDEFLKKFGPDKFRVLLDRSENQAEYQLLSLQNKYDLSFDDQKVAFVKEAASLISTFANAVEREVYGARAANAAGVTADTMKLEIDRAFRRRKAAERKKQERADLDVVGQLQPRERGLHYSNPSSAAAEEMLLAQLLKDPTLLPTVNLLPQQFSSPLLGKVFGLMLQLQERGRAIALGALSGDLTAEEMNHLTAVSRKKDVLVSETAIRDCAGKIRDEYEKSLGTDEAALLARQARLKAKKGYGG